MLFAEGQCTSVHETSKIEIIGGKAFISAVVSYDGVLKAPSGSRDIGGPWVELRYSIAPVKVMVKSYDEFRNEFAFVKPGQLWENLVLIAMLEPE